MNKSKNHESVLKYRKTISGVVTQIFASQKNSSKKRGHDVPDYSREWLIEWLCSQSLFFEIYKKWVESDYKSSLKPSIDRINDNIGYTKTNIQLLNWGIHIQKRSKGVIQIKNGNLVATFESIIQAEKFTGVIYQSIYKAIKGETSHAGGYQWKYK